MRPKCPSEQLTAHFPTESARFRNSRYGERIGRLINRTHDGVLGPETYNAYVPHPITGWRPDVGERTAHRVNAAGERLARLPSTLPDHPSMAWCLNRAEGIASSDVEGISTTLRSLSLLESLRADRQPWRQERDRQALGAIRATTTAIAIGQRTNAQFAVQDLSEIHRQLFAGTRVPFEPGRVRRDDIWIGPAGATPPEALYVAPPPELMHPLLEDLAGYVSSNDLVHPMLKASVAHLQFETIHPFPDGNGRVGRALIHTVLQRCWTGSVPVPVSAAVSEQKREYFQSLRPYQTYVGDADSEIRQACAEAAVAFIADAVLVACDFADAVAHVVTTMRADWSAMRLRRHSASAAILEALSTMPAATVKYLCDVTERSASSIRRSLRSLIDAGTVTESREDDTRIRVFEVPELLQVVDGRQELLRRCWQAAREGAASAPGALVDEWRRDIASTESSQPEASQDPQCPHVGVRSGARCILTAGHALPHRYS